MNFKKTPVNWRLTNANANRNLEVVKLMIEKDANVWNSGHIKKNSEANSRTKI